MKLIRAFGAVVVGYLVYAFSSMLLVGLVMAQKGPITVGLACVALAAIGWVAGLLAVKVAGSMRRPAGFILAGLVSAATIANLILLLGAEPTWYKVGTLLLTAPVIVIMSFRTAK